MDISDEMIDVARDKYKSRENLYFSMKWPKDNFDYIFMSDVIEHLDSPKDTFLKIHKLMGEKTIFINTMANPIWEPALMIAEKIGLKMPEGPHKRVKFEELRFMIYESGMRIVKHSYTLLIPVNIPIITDFVNKYFEKIFRKFAFIEYFASIKT